MAEEKVPQNNEEEAIQVHTKREHSSFGGLILIFIGVIFFLNSMGFLSWKIWRNLINYWPIILIILGLRIILGRSFLANLIVTIIGVAALVFILLYTISNSGNFNLGF